MENTLPNQIVVEGKIYDLMMDTQLAQFTNIDLHQMVVYIEIKPDDEYTGNTEDYKRKLLKFKNPDRDILIYEVLDWLLDSQIIKEFDEEQAYFMKEYFPKREYYYQRNKDFNNRIFEITAKYNKLIYEDPGEAIDYIKKVADQMELSEEDLMEHIDNLDFFYDEEMMEFLYKNNPGMIKIKEKLIEKDREPIYENIIDSQALRVIPLNQIDGHFENFTDYILKFISGKFNKNVEFFKKKQLRQVKGHELIELFFGPSGCDLNAEYLGEEVYRDAFIGFNILKRNIPDSSYLKFILEENGGSYACKMLLEIDTKIVDQYFNHQDLIQNLNIHVEDLLTLFLFYNFENSSNPAAIEDGENSVFFWTEFVGDNYESVNELDWYKNNRYRIEKFGERIPTNSNY